MFADDWLSAVRFDGWALPAAAVASAPWKYVIAENLVRKNFHLRCYVCYVIVNYYCRHIYTVWRVPRDHFTGRVERLCVIQHIIESLQ
jgi:hypothetical protein